MLIKDLKTGKWYDPEVEFQKMLRQQWFIDVMKRLATK